MANMSSSSASAVVSAAGEEFRVEGSEVTICETFRHGPLSSKLTIYGTREDPPFRLNDLEKLLEKTNLRQTVLPSMTTRNAYTKTYFMTSDNSLIYTTSSSPSSECLTTTSSRSGRKDTTPMWYFANTDTIALRSTARGGSP